MRYYEAVEISPRSALLVRKRLGGGFSRVAQLTSLDAAKRLADELNGTNVVHRDVVVRAVDYLEMDAEQADTAALELLKDCLSAIDAGPEEDEPKCT